jgi:hypothetical protein
LQLQKGAQVFVTVKGLKVFTDGHSPMTRQASEGWRYAR